MSTTEIFLLAMLLIFAVPYLVWRLGRTDYFAPLVVVQIVMGLIMGPGIMGAAFPDYHKFVFQPDVVKTINGIALWGVMLFVMLAGVELDLRKTWLHRRESFTTAGLSLTVPLICGCIAALLLLNYEGWKGPKAADWQFMVGTGMACAVTALPVLVMLMEKLEILRQPMGQRLLRYASLDDVAIWGVLALLMLDWDRVGRQATFLVGFAVLTYLFRRLMVRLETNDRWAIALIWLILCAFGADWAGLHYMVGAFLAGVVMDAEWFDQEALDALFKNVLLVMMPVFFLSTGLRTKWDVGGYSVFFVAGLLMLASVGGKVAAAHIAGKILKWKDGEASIIGWLLQSKGLIEIVFANILLDKQIITSETFTALLLMAVGSTMLTIPMVHPKLNRAQNRGLVGQAS
ncbi:MULTISPECIES: cation:proton antiporter [unclassified Duganella]|uniref:cation:proton antiporter n=1 Tax=unclassified Duganella TaxID=2636909 RepID=UPI000886E17B|nr:MULTISPECIES: cation:proton antiporter [unclassified Duganella]SDG81690.1 Kef-type K+ transport system, membrane component KefB [Duganella sp. OV458]SDK09103.1 transporter, CPA2 family [Duganella sp. OV510]